MQSFVGRDEDIAWLLQQCASEAGVTLAPCGPGGMGKTALEVEALTRLQTQQDCSKRFSDGIFYHSFYRSPSLDVAFENLVLLLERGPLELIRAVLPCVIGGWCSSLMDEVLPDSLALREIGGRHVVLLLSHRHADAPDLAHCRIFAGLPLTQGVELVQRLADPRAADRTCVERLVRYVSMAIPWPY